MASESQIAIAIVQKVLTFVRSLSEDEVLQLVSGRAKLVLMPREGTRKQAVEVDANELRAALAAQDSRQAGLEVLAGLAPNRAALEASARALDLPVSKAEGVEQLRDRIVEATIGFRLRSQAIRGDGQG